jgi:hypothetical protein
MTAPMPGVAMLAKLVTRNSVKSGDMTILPAESFPEV